jgi:hypothetical protein
VRRGVGAVVALALAACGPRPAVAPAAPDPPVPSGLVVTLVWEAPVDLDLYVTDPAHETVYFANPRTRSGGVLERDARCADDPGTRRRERVRWTAPPPGRYRVGVDFLERCAGADTGMAAFQLLVDVGGQRQDVPGTARPSERLPLVLELTVPGEVRR